MENETLNKRTYKRKAETTPYAGIGKLPPSATDIEEVVLGTLLMLPINEILFATIKSEFFYMDSHQRIFAAISLLHKEKSPIDVITVVAKLRSLGELEIIGGPYYLTELTNRVTNSTNLQAHILIIHQLYLKRELIRISWECQNDMYNDTGDPLEAITTIVRQVKDLEKGIFKRQEKDSKKLSNEAQAEMNTPKPNGLLGISTGLRGLDYVMKGMQKGKLNGILAETSMGKTMVMCTLAKNCCFDNEGNLLKEQNPVVVFSLEMDGYELTYRMISDISSVPIENIQENRLDATERIIVKEAFEKFEKSKIYIDDTPGISISELEVKIATMVALYSIMEVYIDYYQLIIWDKAIRDREGGLADVSRRLKKLARDLNISITVFSQVPSDDVNKRYLKIPLKDDVKYCKGFANDADLIMIIWRPDYYESVVDELEKSGGINLTLFNQQITDFKGVGFIIIAKQRNGKLGRIPFKFKLNTMQVQDHHLVLDAIGNGNNKIEEMFSDKPSNFIIRPSLMGEELTTEQREAKF